VIAFLRGRVLDNDGESAVVEAGGVGYQVFVSAKTAAALPAVGSETELFVHAHFIQDEPLRLYGFTDVGERRLMQTLISVQGVSPRIALQVLAAIEPEELVRAIATGDVGRLTQVKGVGRKIAERLALELREKILTLPAGKGAVVPAPVPAAGRVPAGVLGDVYGALTGLGYKPAEIEPLLETMDAARPVAELVRDALSALRRK
jgi:holliday junction DNA helicase RuvA